MANQLAQDVKQMKIAEVFYKGEESKSIEEIVIAIEEMGLLSMDDNRSREPNEATTAEQTEISEQDASDEKTDSIPKIDVKMQMMNDYLEKKEDRIRQKMKNDSNKSDEDASTKQSIEGTEQKEAGIEKANEKFANPEQGNPATEKDKLFSKSSTYVMELIKADTDELIKISQMDDQSGSKEFLLNVFVALKLLRLLNYFINYLPDLPSVKCQHMDVIKTKFIKLKGLNMFLDLVFRKGDFYLQMTKIERPSKIRTRIAILSSGLNDFKNELERSLEKSKVGWKIRSLKLALSQSSTRSAGSQTSAELKMPPIKHLKSQGKTFSFVMRANDKGRYLRIIDCTVKKNVSITIPDVLFHEFIDILNTYVNEELK